jgi:hypothetical protein
MHIVGLRRRSDSHMPIKDDGTPPAQFEYEPRAEGFAWL